MAETRWRDLDIRLNVPYLFRHLGNCDHTLRITEVHEANALCHVPQTLTSGPIMYKQCGACQRRVAKYLTMDDIHAHTNPAFWCAHCFDLVHFTATGEPQYQAYKVFPLTWIDS
ncbi:hypothetical protein CAUPRSCDRAFT_12162 [Caulochytrium protostelioides]|nr:hypothetical protein CAUPRSCDRAFT_12162 [Caulochytrium protostelioides]